MIIEKKIKMILPSEHLGTLIASEDAKTQTQVLKGMASRQLMNCIGHNQPIINLATLLDHETVLWIARIYKELVKKERIPKTVDREIHS